MPASNAVRLSTGRTTRTRVQRNVFGDRQPSGEEIPVPLEQQSARPRCCASHLPSTVTTSSGRYIYHALFALFAASKSLLRSVSSSLLSPAVAIVFVANVTLLSPAAWVSNQSSDEQRLTPLVNPPPSNQGSLASLGAHPYRPVSLNNALPAASCLQLVLRSSLQRDIGTLSARTHSPTVVPASLVHIDSYHRACWWWRKCSCRAQQWKHYDRH